VLVLKTGNRTGSNRTAQTIDRVVVHVTEGRFLGSVHWLRSHHSHGSSHYVVSRRGEVVQLVSVSDVAWHAGNRWTNRHSIGIEHEGWTFRAGFTDSQYRASARLVGYLAHRGWDSTTVANGRHMLVVRAYGRRGFRSRKSVPIRVANPPLELTLSGTGAGVHGVAEIGVKVSEKVKRVALYVDGRPVSRNGRAPYALVWNTTAETEGPHDVVVYARGRNGRRAAQRLSLIVANADTVPPSLQLAWHGRLGDDELVR
jgi:hypothetical protein